MRTAKLLPVEVGCIVLHLHELALHRVIGGDGVVDYPIERPERIVKPVELAKALTVHLDSGHVHPRRHDTGVHVVTVTDVRTPHLFVDGDGLLAGEISHVRTSQLLHPSEVKCGEDTLATVFSYQRTGRNDCVHRLRLVPGEHRDGHPGSGIHAPARRAVIQGHHLRQVIADLETVVPLHTGAEKQHTASVHTLAVGVMALQLASGQPVVAFHILEGR